MNSAPTQASLVASKIRHHIPAPHLSQGDNGQRQYELHELLRYENADFVSVAYATVLRRQPDDEGFNTYLERLQSGMPRELLLYRLRHSQEGRTQGVEIPGLTRSAVLAQLGRIPVVGWVVDSLRVLVTLPSLRRRILALEASTGSLGLETETQRQQRIAELEARVLELERNAPEGGE